MVMIVMIIIIILLLMIIISLVKKKNPPANAGDIRDVSLIPASGRSSEGGMATHSNILGWRIPWTEDPSGL